MAPSKRKADEAQTAEAAAAAPATTKARKSRPPPDPTFTRVTRSATVKKGAELPAESKAKAKKEAKGKGKAKKGKNKKSDEGDADLQEEKEQNDSVDAATGNGNEDSEVSEKDVEVDDADEADESKGKEKTIVIEHCKQCSSFKTRALQVKKGLEEGVPGITVHVNPDKPRRGCFEIRDSDGEKFISLLDMKRPFTPMKQLDMDKVISDIIEQIKC